MGGPRIRGRAARGRGVALTAALGLVVALLAVAPASASVPRANGDNAVITVEVGSARQADGQIAPLQGVSLQLLTYDGDNSPGAPVDTAWSTCTSNAQGDCSFVVPETQAAAGGSSAGVNRNRRFWVTQVSAPTGWFTNPTLRTGTATSSESTAQPYRFLTGTELHAGNTYRSGTSFMSTVGGSTAEQRLSSGGVWQQSRDNPGPPSRCGLDVALILDLSGSVGDQIGALRGAGNAFVDALKGTPSRMSVFSFSYGSPAQNATKNYPDLQPVSDTSGGNIVKGWIADGTPAGGTNWDRGIQAAADANRLRPAEDRYDMAVILTDGNPTNWGGTGTTSGTVNGNGSNNRIIEVEKAIFSANALKAQGTRVIGFGVGAGVTDPNTAFNLRSISGPNRFGDAGVDPIEADFFQEPSYTDAAEALRSIALAKCAGTISVLKMIVPPGNTGEDVTGAYPAPKGWTFNASTTATPPVAVTPTTATTIDDDTGVVNFALDFSGGATTAGVTITEIQQEGHVLVQRGGANAVCTNLGTNTAIPVVNLGNPTAPNPGFTVTAPRDQAISCTVYDRPPQPPPVAEPADLTVFKGWVVRVGDRRKAYREGEQPGFLQAQLTLTSAVDGTSNDHPWGVKARGYAEGDKPEIDERVQVNRPRCELVASRVVRANGERVNERLPFRPTLRAGSNRYLVVNVVTCTTRLTLRKIVLDRGTDTDAAPPDWTLTADGRTRVSGPGNSAAVTKQLIGIGRYRLSESGGPPGFDSSGWFCRGAEKLRPSRFIAEPGQDIICIIVNVAQPEPQPEPEPEPPPEPQPQPQPQPPPEVLPAEGFVRTVTSQSRVRPGEPFHDRITVRGLVGGDGATAVARLYGPFSSRAAAECRPGFLVREEVLQVDNGRNRSPSVRVNSPGVYTWQVAIGADAATASAAHRCGQARETTVVAKPAYIAPAVVGGFSGTLPGFDRDRRVSPSATVEMPAIGMRATVQRHGIRGGKMTLPGDVGDVAWLHRSAGFGDMIGTTVVGGHVSDRHDRPGAMFNLSRARAGQRITVSKAGEQYRFRVVDKATLNRHKKLPDRYFATTGRHRMVLISCTDRVVTAGGHFHYTRYVVVVAKPIRD